MVAGNRKRVAHAVILAVALVATGPQVRAAEPESLVLPLYEEGETASLGVSETQVKSDEMDETLIFNVSNPTLELFRPAPGTATRAAVIVAPGGGFVALGYDQGGTAIARRLSEQGITALVLKYRTIRSTGDPMQLPPLHQAEMEVLVARATSGSPVEIPAFAGEAMAVADGAKAMAIVRHHAAEWGIDPDRVGMLGFSAGAFIANDLAVGAAATRPDFVGLLYGGLRGPVPADASPAFIAAAADDELLASDSPRIFAAWRAAGVPAELHIYERGGHGFDLRPNATTSDQWFAQFVGWMRARKILGPKG